MEKRYLPEDEETADQDPRFIKLYNRVEDVDDLTSFGMSEADWKIYKRGMEALRERALREKAEREKAEREKAERERSLREQVEKDNHKYDVPYTELGAGATPTFSIVVKDGPFGVDLRELHRDLESKRKFADWAQANLSQFVEGEDYVSFHNIVKRETGASRRTDYAVSIEVAKHIAMMENTERGKQVRQYFIECEKALKARVGAEYGVRPVTTLRESLVLSLELLDRNETLALINTEQANLIEQQAHKVKFVDRSSHRAIDPSIR